MKEFTAAFQSEVFRPIVTLVVPGFFAVSTPAAVVWTRSPELRTFASQHSGLATTATLLVVLTCGLIIEDLGARLEKRFDLRLQRTPGFENHTEEWYSYLRIAFDKEPVGHRYLRTLVLRLKFELGMAFATLPFAAGAFWLQFPLKLRLMVAGIALFACWYFQHEARSSNRALSELRREMLKKSWDGSVIADDSRQDSWVVPSCSPAEPLTKFPDR